MTQVTLDEVQALADILTRAEKVRLIAYINAQLRATPARASDSGSALGQQLRSIRSTILASGLPVLDEEQLRTELAERRGER